MNRIGKITAIKDDGIESAFLYWSPGNDIWVGIDGFTTPTDTGEYQTKDSAVDAIYERWNGEEWEITIF